jgi:hypothetical protein
MGKSETNRTLPYSKYDARCSVADLSSLEIPIAE